MPVSENKENSLPEALGALNKERENGENGDKMDILLFICRLSLAVEGAVGFLTSELDGKSYGESLQYVWKNWTHKPHVEVRGYTWIFDLILKLIRWDFSQ